ncbi:MAG: type II secretion system major pseudopilin GspG [Planctomycetota bacterium]
MRLFQKRFSLIELMVVISILGILATVVSINVMDHLSAARQTKAKVQIQQFTESLGFYFIDNHTYPSTSEGLQKLAEKPAKKTNPYMDAIPVDPWSRPYEYRAPTQHKFDIISYGRDGTEGGEGEDMDIKSWEIVETQSQ